MTFERSVAGALALLIVVASIIQVARFTRRRLLPSWSGSPAWLADAVAAIGIAIGAAEILGVVGAFRPVALVVLLAAAAACSILFDRMRPVRKRSMHPACSYVCQTPPRERWFERVGAVFAVALLGADWAPETIHTYSVGMTGTDSLWYHGPVAANFVLTGHILPLYNIGNDNTVEFYPFSSELVHAVGMTLMGSDVLSPLVNLWWLTLTLFAAWCIGRRFGVGSIAIIATAVVMGTTEIIADNPGEGYNDVVGVGLVLASVALLVNAGYLRSWSSWQDLRPSWFAALAAGLAAGVKYPMLVPVVALTLVFAVLVPSKARLRALMQWCLIVIVAGGLWYVRNLVYAGNPIPNEHVHLGFITLPSPPTIKSSAPLHFLFNEIDWRRWFIPGFSQAFGPVWWAILGLAVLGLVGGLLGLSAWYSELGSERRRAAKSDRRITPHYALTARTLAVVGIASVGGYVLTPEPGLPVSFVYDIRFMILGVLSGVLALTVTVSRHRTKAFVLLGVLACSLIATQFARGIWLSGLSLIMYQSPALSAAIFFVILVIGLAGLALRSRIGQRAHWGSDRRADLLNRRKRFAFGAVAICAIALLGLVSFPLQRYYLDHRYEDRQFPLDVWVEGTHHARIGVQGNVILNYPLYGSDFSNSVISIGAHGPYGADYPITSCAQFMRTIVTDRLRYVAVVGQYGYDSSTKSYVIKGLQAAAWLKTQPAHVVLTQAIFDVGGVQKTILYEVKGTLEPRRCTRS